MEGTRLQKVERLVQKEVGEIVRRRTPELFPGLMVTITRARVSPDLALAKLYTSVFPSQHAQAAVDTLTRNVKTLRMDLGRQLRHQLRIIPEMAFFIDDSLDYIDRIDQLLQK